MLQLNGCKKVCVKIGNGRSRNLGRARPYEPTGSVVIAVPKPSRHHEALPRVREQDLFPVGIGDTYFTSLIVRVERWILIYTRMKCALHRTRVLSSYCYEIIKADAAGTSPAAKFLLPSNEMIDRWIVKMAFLFENMCHRNLDTFLFL